MTGYRNPQQDKTMALNWAAPSISLNPSFTDPPYCSCRESREDLSPCGLESGQPETFRAEPNNSNYASWLYSPSFFSSLFSTSFQPPLFPFLLLSLSSTLKLLQHVPHLCISAAPHDLSSSPVLPFFLLYLSLCASSPFSRVWSTSRSS